MLLITFHLLISAFLCHLLWWRICYPKNATKALLLLFFIVGGLFSVFWLTGISNVSLSSQCILQILMLYTGCCLVYTIIYSAIEQQSPTLKIIWLVHQAGDFGCADDILREAVSVEDPIDKRLRMMEVGGWLCSKDGCWVPTQKGYLIGLLFGYAAILFGIRDRG